MNSQKIKHLLIWSIVGLVVIAATAYGATVLYAPPPPLIPVATAPTADELYQQELTEAEAIRTCGVYDKPQKERTSEIDGSMLLEDCIQENRKCQALWGPHAVYDGTARSVFGEAGNEQLIPNCKCDQGYEWLNTDGTIGITMYDGSVFNMIDGPGKCVVQQQR